MLILRILSVGRPNSEGHRTWFWQLAQEKIGSTDGEKILADGVTPYFDADSKGVAKLIDYVNNGVTIWESAERVKALHVLVESVAGGSVTEKEKGEHEHHDNPDERNTQKS